MMVLFLQEESIRVCCVQCSLCLGSPCNPLMLFFFFFFWIPYLKTGFYLGSWFCCAKSDFDNRFPCSLHLQLFPGLHIEVFTLALAWSTLKQVTSWEQNAFSSVCQEPSYFQPPWIKEAPRGYTISM